MTGKSIFKVVDIKGKDVVLKVIEGGIVKRRKGVNFPNSKLNLPAVSKKDREDLKYACEADFDIIAVSFVRNKKDILEVKKVLKENGKEDIKIIAKIENAQGIENMEEILEEADGIMIARGDLSVEIPTELVPIYQKNIIKLCNKNGKAVIVATQMLESMIENSSPTRAEVSDVANAIYDKTGAIMLSGETAVGKYPVKCVELMTKIAKSIENNIRYWKRLDDMEINPVTASCKANVLGMKAARSMEVDAIIAYTHTGKSIEIMSGMGPACPIFAVTDNKKTYNQLSIMWNVFPIYVEKEMLIDEMIEEVISTLRKHLIIEKGDVIYITGGDNFIKGAKESMRIGGIAVF